MPFKSLTIADGFDPAVLQTVRTALPELEAVLGRKVDAVDVNWEPSPLRGGALLTLGYDGGTKTDRFDPVDFADRWEFQWHGRRLWDSLLADRIRVRMAAIKAELAEAGAE